MTMKLMLMADYCSSGLWVFDEHGDCSIELDRAPIPHWLKSQIEQWQAWYDRESFTTYPLDQSPSGYNHKFNLQEFSAVGLALAHKVRFYLPSGIELWYYDEYVMNTLGRSADQHFYEIK